MSSSSSSSSSSTCTQTCGWIGAWIACLCFGSFAVPLKSHTAQSLDIDPLVFQSYKTIMCFLTSWIFIFIFHQPITFTPWGIVSAIFWVPAAVCAVYAIQHAGLAIAIALSSTCIVLVSFSWGIFIFHETVQSQSLAIVAVGFMILGILGMSYFATPSSCNLQSSSLSYLQTDDPSSIRPTSVQEQDSVCTSQNIHRTTHSHGKIRTYQNIPHKEEEDDLEVHHSDDHPIDTKSTTTNTNKNNSNVVHIEMDTDILDITKSYTYYDRTSFVIIYGIHISRRTTGLIAAIFNGLWGGSILVPMHFAPANSGGIGYLISFSTGACIITLFLWMVRYIYLLIYQTQGSMYDAYKQLPSFHLRKMWFLGGIAGTLWSTGNVASFFSVKYLGQATGYSITQAAMIVSGLWGIFYYEEVTNRMNRILWFSNVFLTLSGIILLSYEHNTGT